MWKEIIFGLFLTAACTIHAKADTVILQSGTVVTGKVLQQDRDGVLIEKDYGTFRYPLSWIKDIRKEKVSAPVESSTQRIPNWGRIMSTLATNVWAHELKQIPATVIDNGILKDVPYVSFRCNGGGYEINVYGDLDNPAGVEIGAINYLTNNDQAKSNCMNFISSLLASDDKVIARSLNVRQKDTQKREGLTFETTFPDEPDAYGGWWISVYAEDALTNARASGPELLAITQPRTAPEPPPVAVISQPPVTAPEISAWSPSDISYARPSSSSGSDGGSVYVRGYYRKNGTYVHSYTRSAPHRH